jgi:hypothetical protein
MACSTWLSRSQAPCVELLLQLAHLLEQFLGVVGRHLLGDLVVLGEELLGLGHAVLDVAEDVLVSSSSGSWASRPTVKPGSRRASPLDGCSTPAIILSKVDLPVPFGPTTPILAPGRKASVTLSR